MAYDTQHTTPTVDLLDGTPTSVSGQGVLPSFQATMGCAAVSPKLSAKHEAFCWEYIATCGNGTQAYLRVYPGVTERTARVNASRLLTNADIKARVEEILQERRNRHALLQDKVIDYHRSVMLLDRFGLLDPKTGALNLKRFTHEDPDTGEPVFDLPQEVRDVLEIEQVSAKDGVRTLLKVPTRHSSAQELARVLGMNKESMELSGPNGGPVEMSSTGDAATLEALRQAFDKHVSTSS